MLQGKTIKPNIKKKHSRKLKIFFLLLIFCAVLFGFYYLFFQASFFKIKSFTVSGSSTFTPENLIKTGFGKNIFSSVKLNDLPLLLEEASISKNYFKRTVLISLKEREKFGIWCQKTEESLKNCFWFDKLGKTFLSAPLSEGGFVKLVESDKPLSLGGKVMEENFFNNLLKIFNIASELKIPEKHFSVFQDKEEVFLNASEKTPEIYFSLRFNPDFSAKALESFKPDFKKIIYIDLRSENRVFYKYK
ncbi:MAG: hypothetical protein A2430_00700 [Candidatus Liptonbacteria bacterium RIFOXYC1_FULL_36_8]|uniref:POTRA domain-containing protein n=1 Tax=Candidatus Liptonbacteria bacterium RIFOXYC1_FULL_36_8 TaxID=1798655 RepID=A0A1G2CNR9_9BACT|nr:MAG: hypothetical protein A2430_00700 [Candidatus Liptonbacteria bacterium RIFOXYC1_FULL_36_8]